MSLAEGPVRYGQYLMQVDGQSDDFSNTPEAMETFETGIRKTVQWYLPHGDWVARVQNGAYSDWMAKQYGESQQTSGVSYA